MTYDSTTNDYFEVYTGDGSKWKQKRAYHTETHDNRQVLYTDRNHGMKQGCDACS